MSSAQAGPPSKVHVAWPYVGLPFGFLVLMPEPALLVFFCLPVGAVLALFNSTRVDGEGVAHVLGLVRKSRLRWDRIQVIRIWTQGIGCVVDVDIIDGSYRRLFGFTRFRARKTVELVLDSMPKDMFNEVRVEVPRGWTGPHVERLAQAAGEQFSRI